MYTDRSLWGEQAGVGECLPDPRQAVRHSGHLGADLQPGRAGPGGTPFLRSAREPGRGHRRRAAAPTHRGGAPHGHPRFPRCPGCRARSPCAREGRQPGMHVQPGQRYRNAGRGCVSHHPAPGRCERQRGDRDQGGPAGGHSSILRRRHPVARARVHSEPLPGREPGRSAAILRKDRRRGGAAGHAAAASTEGLRQRRGGLLTPLSSGDRSRLDGRAAGAAAGTLPVCPDGAADRSSGPRVVWDPLAQRVARTRHRGRRRTPRRGRAVEVAGMLSGIDRATPRAELRSLARSWSISAAAWSATSAAFSRVPTCEESPT